LLTVLDICFIPSGVAPVLVIRGEAKASDWGFDGVWQGWYQGYAIYAICIIPFPWAFGTSPQ